MITSILRSTRSCFSALLLAGCANATSPYGAAPASTTPGRFAVAPAAAPAPAVAVAGPVARDDVEAIARRTELDRVTFVRAVLARNRSIESARQAWRAASARAQQAGAYDDPMVTLEIAPLSVVPSKAPFGYTAMASQRVPWPGKLALDGAIGKAEAEAAKSDVEGVRRELALTAALLYDDYYVAVRSLDVTGHHVALMRELKASALSQFETGRASAQDALQAEAELARMDQDALVLATDRDVAVAQMNELMHRDPDSPLPPPPSRLGPSDRPDPLDTKRGPDVSPTRPEIEAARLHARAERFRAERAERDAYPDLTLSTSYNSMWDMPEHRWMVGVGINLPFHGERRASAADEARAASAQLESEAERLTDKARAEASVARKRLTEAGRVLQLLEGRLIPIAREQIDAARAGFVTSRNDFASVVEAERNLRSVELDLERARANVDRRSAELARALGRVPALESAGEVAR